MSDIENMLTAQLQLQRDSFKLDPTTMDAEERARFLQWNFTALVTELGEAFNEVGWKPWASDRSMDPEKFIKEMVDAWHFFMNMLLTTRLEPPELAKIFYQEYFLKRAKNAQRQLDGYTGKNKCAMCHRELDGVLDSVQDEEGTKFCNLECQANYHL